MSDRIALNALEVLEAVLQRQSGTVTKGLIEAVYAAGLKHQYDAPDETALHDTIRTLVTDYVSAQLGELGGDATS